MSLEKKDWSSPVTSMQEFAPQEFVAVCEDRNKWGATCTNDWDKRGYIFFDVAEDNVFSEDDRKLYDRSEHGGCGRTHYFYSDTRPGFNAWVLSDEKLGSHDINYYTETRQGQTGRFLKEGFENLLTPALVKKPGEALDGNWLVCFDLADLRNPS